jgi:hypothetical protein
MGHDILNCTNADAGFRFSNNVQGLPDKVFVRIRLEVATYMDRAG